MTTSPFAGGQNCATLWSPMVVAASSASNCFNMPELSGASPAEREQLIQLCQQGIPDLRLLCWIYCCCRNNPVPSQSGKTNGYQQCVTNTLDQANDALGGRSRYRPEQAYNMTTEPPTPLMSRNDPMVRSRNWPYNPGNYVEDFQARQGQIRVPDVVIVRDVSRPPTQDNISQIVEMKFTEAGFDPAQTNAYRRIHPNVTEMDGRNGTNCDCEEWERKGRELELQDSLLLKLLELLLFRGRRPRIPMPMPAPVPVPGIA